MVEIEQAWAAGFFDGEGSVHLSKGRYVVVSAVQVRREPLDRLQAALGGLGMIYGPNTQGAYEWKTTNFADSRKVLLILEPLLSAPKREQAETVLAIAPPSLRPYAHR